MAIAKCLNALVCATNGRRARGIMQQKELVSRVINRQATSSKLKVAGERTVFAGISSYRPGLDYPCGCRHCRQMKTTPGARETSALAAVDVYDLPDGIDPAAADYFH